MSPSMVSILSLAAGPRLTLMERSCLLCVIGP